MLKSDIVQSPRSWSDYANLWNAGTTPFTMSDGTRISQAQWTEIGAGVEAMDAMESTQKQISDAMTQLSESMGNLNAFDPEKGGFSVEDFTEPFTSTFQALSTRYEQILRLSGAEAQDQARAFAAGSGDLRPWVKYEALRRANQSSALAYGQSMVALHDAYAKNVFTAISSYAQLASQYGLGKEQLRLQTMTALASAQTNLAGVAANFAANLYQTSTSRAIASMQAAAQVAAARISANASLAAAQAEANASIKGAEIAAAGLKKEPEKETPKKEEGGGGTNPGTTAAETSPVGISNPIIRTGPTSWVTLPSSLQLGFTGEPYVPPTAGNLSLGNILEPY